MLTVGFNTTTLGEVLAQPDLFARLRALTLAADSDMSKFLNGRTRGYRRVILAEAESHVVGWAVMYGAVARSSYLDVFVDPDHRGQGIGRELVAQARNIFLKERTGELCVSDAPIYRWVLGVADRFEPGNSLLWYGRSALACPRVVG